MRLLSNWIRPVLLSLVCLAGMLWIVGCNTGPCFQTGAETTQVLMTANSRFLPDTIYAPAGAVITWTNMCDVPHTVTSDPCNPVPCGPNSDCYCPNGLVNGGTYSWTIPIGAPTGTIWYYYDRYCGFPGNGHVCGTGMVGRIVVR